MEVSGQWTQNTVKAIATHPLLIAVCEYGKRSEGDQLRFTKNGPRPLNENDYHPDGKLKTVTNPADQIIRTPAKSKAVIAPEKFERIRAVLEYRGRHLKGKARTRGQSPNPLGGRIFDLNCGWLMYRYAKRRTVVLHLRAIPEFRSKVLRHNTIKGEQATRFVLACLQQKLFNPSTLAKLKARLGELATTDQGEDPAQRQLEAEKSELVALRRKLQKVGQNMAWAETREERDTTAAVFRELKEQESRLEQRIAAHRPVLPQGDPQREVEAALGTLDRLSDSVSNSAADWSVISNVFNQTNAKLYLRFAGVEKGRRKFNVPAGGVMTFGSTPPPGPLYTGPTDRAIIRKMLATGESVTAFPECVASGDSNAGQDVIRSANVQRGTRRCT